MMRIAKLIIALALLAGSVQAQLPTGTGWKALGSTTVLSDTTGTLCPTSAQQASWGIQATNGCVNGMYAYSGAIFDDYYDRWLKWGGGHMDYLGNELYSIRLTGTPAMARLSAPDHPVDTTTCLEAQTGGYVTTGHTYGGLVYIPPIAETSHRPLMLSFGRKLACGGGWTSQSVWALDLFSVPPGTTSTPSWTKQLQLEAPSAAPTYFPTAAAAVYDPNNHIVFVSSPTSSLGRSTLYKYRLDNHTLTSLLDIGGTPNTSTNYVLAFDPQRRYIFTSQLASASLTGQYLLIIDVGTPATGRITETGSETLTAGAVTKIDVSSPSHSCHALYDPGFTADYDPVWGLFLAYPSHGNTVYLFNPDLTKTVQAGTYGSVGPRQCVAIPGSGTAGVDYPADAMLQGEPDGNSYPISYGSFRYVKQHDVFVYSPKGGQQAFIFRLNRTMPDTLTIRSQSGTQSNRVFSVGRVFKRGEIANYPQPTGGSITSWQANVKNYWYDGTVKYAVVSGVVPSLTTSDTTITFSNSTNSSSVGSGNPIAYYADPANGYDLGAKMELIHTGVATQTLQLSDLISAGKCTNWLSGPVVNAFVCADHAGRSTDTKMDALTGNPLHPIFEVWCYTQGTKCEIGFTIENAYISNTAGSTARDQTFQWKLYTGAASPTLVYDSSSEVTLIAFARFHKSYWIGAAPTGIHIDHNTRYLIDAGALPNYDLTRDVTTAASGFQTAWAAKTSAELSLTGTTGTCHTNSEALFASGCIGDWELAPNGSGAHYNPGPLPPWEVLYWQTMDDALLGEVIADSDLFGYWPVHFRESDNLAGKYFTGSTGTQGRTASVNARPTIDFGDLSNSGGADKPNSTVGSQTKGKWTSSGIMIAPHHWPESAYTAALTTGKNYYIEELQMQGATAIGVGNSGTDYYGHFGALGIFGTSAERIFAWSTRTTSRAAFLSTDSSPEQSYFTTKLYNNLAFLKGTQGLCDSGTPASCSDYAGENATAYTTGRDWAYGAYHNSAPTGVMWYNFENFLQPGDDQWPCNGYVGQASLTTNVGAATGTFQEAYLAMGVAIARDLGYGGTDNFLKLLARRPSNIVLNPNVTNKYVNGNTSSNAGYAHATRRCTTNSANANACNPSQPGCITYGTIIDYSADNWADYTSFYSALPTGWPTGLTQMEDSHPAEVLASLAMMADQTSTEGYNAGAAYSAMKASASSVVNLFGSMSPKFDIVPRSAPLANASATYTITTVASTTRGSSGTITCTPSTMAAGTSYSCTQSAGSGSSFTLFTSDCGGTGTTTYSGTMPAANCTLTATFIPVNTLTVSKTGSGTVTSSPAGIDCGATCANTMAGMVSLNQTPDSGYQFAGWSGGCTGTGACSVSMVAPVTVGATFTLIGPTVSSVAVSTGTPSIVEGNTADFACTATMSSGPDVDCTALASWSSSNTAVATITGGVPGRATGVSAGGPVTITATYQGVSGTASLTVTTPPTQVPTSISGSVVIGGSAVIH